MKATEKFLIVFVAALLTWGTLTIVRAAHTAAGEGDVPPTPSWKPPAIAQCDKGLYERITEGCDD